MSKQKTIDRKQLVKLIKKNRKKSMVISWVKKNGEPRTAHCTIYDPSKEALTRVFDNKNPHLLITDLEKGAPRTVIFENIKSIGISNKTFEVKL